MAGGEPLQESEPRKKIYMQKYLRTTVILLAVFFYSSVTLGGNNPALPGTQVIDERHVVSGSSWTLNIPEGGILLPGSVTIKDEATGTIYERGKNFLAYNAHAQESGFTNSIWVTVGKGQVSKPIPEGSIVLVSYRYLSGDSLKTSNAAKVVLEKVQDNYAQIQDLTADLTITSTLNGEVFGTPKYGRFIFRAPDKQKIENWTNQDKSKKSGATIVDGEKMYLVNALGSYQEVHYLEGTGTSSSDLNQMDIFYGLDKFLEGHDVLLERDGGTGVAEKDTIVIAAPKQDNGTYTYLSLYIDRQKGIMAKSLLYQGERLVQTLEYEGVEKLGKAWVPTKMINSLHLNSGEFVTKTTFENIQLNTGMQDTEFDPKIVSQEYR